MIFILIEKSPKDPKQKRVTTLLSDVQALGFTFVYLDNNQKHEHFIYKTQTIEKSTVPFAIEIELTGQRKFTFLVPTDLIEPLNITVKES